MAGVAIGMGVPAIQKKCMAGTFSYVVTPAIQKKCMAGTLILIATTAIQDFFVWQERSCLLGTPAIQKFRRHTSGYLWVTTSAAAAIHISIQPCMAGKSALLSLAVAAENTAKMPGCEDAFSPKEKRQTEICTKTTKAGSGMF